MSRTAPYIVHEQECEFEGSIEPVPGKVRWRTLLSGDRTPTDSLTLGVAELAPGEAEGFRVHRHAQAEVYYVLSGEGVVVIDGSEHRVRAGSAVYVPGGAAHGAFNTGDRVLRILYVFAADSFAEVEYEFPLEGDR